MLTIVIERRPGESTVEHHKRLVYGKLVDKTLSDVDYAELAEVLYGKKYASDVARRMMYGSCKTLQLLDKDALSNIGQDDVLGSIEQQTAELKKERYRLFDQRRELNNTIRLVGRKEHLYESLVSAAENLGKTIGNIFEREDRDVEFSDDSPDAILVFSDWHYGMVTNNIFNEYDTTTCIDRVNKVVNSAIDRIERHGCRNLHIVVLGDMFHGAIHASARVASEELVCDQIIQVSEILAQAINKLSQHVENTIVHMTYGNHARTVQKKEDSIHADNIEKIIPWWLETRFENMPNVNVVETMYTNEFLIFEVLGHKFCAVHGDLDSVKSSPKTLYTLFRKKYDFDLDYIILGDKHHRESFEELNITSMLCGSLCGTDDYANDKRLFSTPSQLLLIVSSDCGVGVDAEYRIKC